MSMFRRKKGEGDDEKGTPVLADELGIPAKPSGSRPPGVAPVTPTRTATPLTPTPVTPAAATAPRPVEAARPPEPIRRVEPPVAVATPAPAAKAQRNETDARRLIVGREISLSGEITSCDRLVVEGTVEANIANCRDIEIAEGGLFKGSASIEDAEVSGRFEGTLHVRNRLLVHATGRVIGTVRYGQIEIECGGQISGEIQAQPSDGKPEAALAPAPQPAQPIIVAMAADGKR